jgi:hypothetical protein
MAGASDKARFYLEQFVPELKEYEKKEIFTKVAALFTERPIQANPSTGRNNLHSPQTLRL